MKSKPKGDCFEVALGVCLGSGAVVDALDEFGIPHQDARICHGIVCGQGKLNGVWFAHAWVEARGLAFEFSNGCEFVLPIFQYRTVGRIGQRALYEYSLHEAAKKALQHGHYGPWDFDNGGNENVEI